MAKTVLIIAVHPDDETLGCGGTLLKHLDDGDAVSCLFVTDGNEEQRKIIPKLEAAYGFATVERLSFPDARLDEIPLGDLIPRIAAELHRLQPDTVYIPNRSDAHSDHRKVYEAMIACTKPFRFPFLREVLMMEVLSETDMAPSLPESVFYPNVWVDIGAYFPRKLEIFSLFSSEFLPYPMTRNGEALKAQARYRGSQVNVEYAETFMLLRSIR